MLGPVVRAEAAERIRAMTAQAVAQGARRLMPAQRDLGAAYVAAEVLVGMDHSMPMMREELFGPVACVQSVSGDAAAVSLMNDSAYGLTASVCDQ
jgi:acyl-CoA reductase-like NAD-dependent aldehyde dehydrogenase